MTNEHNDPKAPSVAAALAASTPVLEVPSRGVSLTLTPPSGAVVTMDDARALVTSAIALERELALAEAVNERCAGAAAAAARTCAICQRQASKGWSIARHALRCAARRLPLPTNAEQQIALDLEREQERQDRKTVVLPEDAKPGDTFEDPATGARYTVQLVGGGVLMAFPEA